MHPETKCQGDELHTGFMREENFNESFQLVKNRTQFFHIPGACYYRSIGIYDN